MTPADWKLEAGVRMVRGGLGIVTLAIALLGAPPAVSAGTLYVDQAAAGCSDARSAAQAGALTPWCSLAPAASAARPGDVVRVARGTYRGTFRPLVSGTATAPIRVIGAPDVVLDGAGAAAAVKFIAVAGWSLESLRITGGANQGVWVEASSDVALRNVVVSGNPGAGVQLKGARATTVAGSTLSANGSAGLKEASDVVGTTITSSTITANGLGGAAYNGDGLQLGGTGAVVRGNTIAGNGDPGPYEHGIYTGSASKGWLIEGNTITASGGANIKASGTGTIRGNRLVDGRHGLVLASNPAPVDVFTNVITGRAQHLVFLTTGARGRLYHDTIRQTGRSTTSGEASAVFVAEAVSLEVRNTHVCYDGADDLGIALWINSGSRVGTLSANTNWYCSRDARARHVAYDGSRTTTSAWRAVTGADSASAFSAPPAYDSRSRPLSPLAGAGIGAPLAAVPADFDGLAWPAAGPRDAGAFRLAP
jgi:hypothetical protein